MKLIQASRQDKNKVIEILCSSFIDDPQTNYIIGNERNKSQRLQRLMAYAFEYGMVNGRVELTEDKMAVAIWKNFASKSISIRLMVESLLFLYHFGLDRLKTIKTMEKITSSQYPANWKFDYLWFLGTHPTAQGLGYGTAIINANIEKARLKNMDIYLETSTEKNVDYYSKKGFSHYDSITINCSSPFEIYFFRLLVNR